MARKMKRLRTDNETRGTSDDETPVEETTPPRRRRRSSEVQRCSTKKNKNKGKTIQRIQSLVDRMDEMTSETHKLVEKCIERENNQSIEFWKLIENQSCQIKRLEMVTERLEKLSEGQNDLCNQFELHTKAPRSQWSQEKPPRYQVVFKSNMDEKIEKGKSLKTHVALVDCNSGQTVKDGPLASATVELVVIDAKFNENNNQHNWSIEDFRSNIKKARQGKSATVNVDESGKSIVSNGRFNLENGDKHHCDFSIFENSGNKRFRLGVMVVSTTQERVLEGLSNPFFVRGHDRNRKQARVDNGNQEQSPISNMQSPPCPNSTQDNGNGSVTTPVLGGEYQPLFQRNTFVLSTEPATSQQQQVLHRSMLTQTAYNQTVQAWDGTGNQEQNGPMSSMQNPSCPNSTQAYGNGSFISPVFGGQNQPLFQRNTPVLSTEPASSQQHQIHHWSMLPQASNNPTGLNAIEQIQSHFIENADVGCTEPSASQQAWIPQNQDHWPNLTHQPMNSGTGCEHKVEKYPCDSVCDE